MHHGYQLYVVVGKKITLLKGGPTKESKNELQEQKKSNGAMKNETNNK